MNVYSNDRHSAVKFMLDQIIDIPKGTLTSEMQSGIHLSPCILQLARPLWTWLTLLVLCAHFQSFLSLLTIQTLTVMLTQS